MPPLLALLLLLSFALVATLVAIVHHLASMLLRPPRMTDGKAMYVLRRMSPGDLAMPFEEVSFTARHHAAPEKALKIAGWWIAAGTDSTRTCVIVHGFGDAKVGSLAWAPLWRELGWNLLLIDLRAHGESGGRESTGGFFERDDLDAVLNDLRARLPSQTKTLTLFGISLGGAVVLATAARREDVAAVIADSVFVDYRHAALTHGRLIGAPLPSLTPLAIRWAEHIAHARFDDVRPTETITACRCPVMLVHGDADPFVNQRDVARLAEALSKHGDRRDVHLRVPGAGHCLSIVADAQTYSARLKAFLDAATTDFTSSGGTSTRV